MYIINKTPEFDKWLKKLKDRKAKAKVLLRIQQIEEKGNFGDSEPVGEGITELRIHFAKGYRVYLKRTGNTILLILNGGTKASQQKDIQKAKELWKKYKD